MAGCSTRLMLGNHAIAHGALEAGLAVAAGYPGTPSSEIIEYLMDYGAKLGAYVEWSSNEKVAYEVAYGAALAGAMAMVTMKHVGLNVAMDPLMSSAYTGVKGGLLVVTADDPSMWSSQNEQDNRWVGLHAYIPVIEPYNPQSAHDYARLGLELSHKLSHPVILRSVTRVSHVRAPVNVCEPREPTYGAFARDPSRMALIPANARRLKAELVKKWQAIADAVEELPHEQVGDGDVLVITSGVAYQYVKEALGELGVKATVLNVATPVPPPRKLILNLASASRLVIVVEEGDPVLEVQVKEILHDGEVKVKVYGREEGFFGSLGELTLDVVEDSIASILKAPKPLRPPLKRPSYEPPQRPPVFCPGCPHAASFYELKVASAKLRVKPVFSGDIGCYSLGINRPFDEQDVLTNMGSSIGLAMGIHRGTGGRQVAVAIIGDSTFFHAGLPALVNAIYNKAPMLILVLDNRTTAMTGGQPSPSRAIDIEQAARGLGVKYAYTVDPFNVDEAVKVLQEALSRVVKDGEVAVVVMKRACALEAARVGRRLGLLTTFSVDLDACKACGICYNLLACPAIIPLKGGKAYIDPYSCVGCSVCAQICPYGAIRPMGDYKAWLDAWSKV